ncbi:hypothetical protein [Xanthobacter oligotrophicus]|uniref:hypothetical protein n=1 Tax=Xanthobacter oligotrophicus TaxID=2607286 RepID=UPI001EE61368|nr:hypothetical protein [Xanthobacter oligotrophicus]MCG5238122.1 hypothetical protein [Xanthobacter oligotrophicus]
MKLKRAAWVASLAYLSVAILGPTNGRAQQASVRDQVNFLGSVIIDAGLQRLNYYGTLKDGWFSKLSQDDAFLRDLAKYSQSHWTFGAGAAGNNECTLILVADVNPEFIEKKEMWDGKSDPSVVKKVTAEIYLSQLSNDKLRSGQHVVIQGINAESPYGDGVNKLDYITVNLRPTLFRHSVDGKVESGYMMDKDYPIPIMGFAFFSYPFDFFKIAPDFEIGFHPALKAKVVTALKEVISRCHKEQD